MAAPAPLLIVEARTGGRVLAANDALANLLHLQFVGRTTDESGLSALQPGLATLREAMARGELHVRLQIRRQEGDEVDLLANLARGEFAGQPCYVVALTDVSQRERAEDELRRTEERYRAMVEHVQDYAIFLLDPTGHVQTWNPGAQRIKGYTAEEIIGHSFEEFYPPEYRQAGLPQQLLKQAREKGVVEHEGWRMRKDGTRFWGNIVITALRKSNGDLEGFIKVTRDLTERKQREEADRVAYQRLLEVRSLEEVNHLKSTFLNLCAHELITPMTPLNVMVHSLAKHIEDPELARKLAVVQRNLDRLHRLLGDVLDASRLDARKLKLRKQTVNLVQLVQHAVELRESQAQQRGVTLAFTQPSQTFEVDGDEDRLTQVIDNLLSNALKFTPAGGGINVDLDCRDGQAVLAVADTGAGMDPGFLQRVFEPFSRSERHETQVEPGTGLGLYISKGILELHGGRIHAQSDGPGHGTRMILELPLLSAGRPAPAPTTHPA